MTEEYFWALISFIGLFGQAGITALLWLFFLLLKRHAGRRCRFFQFWSYAWVALVLALSFLAIDFYGLPHLKLTAWELSAVQPALLLLYQLGKFLFLVMLLTGTTEFLSGRLPTQFVRFGWLAGVGAGLASFPLAADLNELMLLQLPFCILVPLYSGVRLLSVPPVRRSLGTRVTGMSFMFYALLWLLYSLALYKQHFIPLQSYTPFVALVADFNGYFDSLLELLMAFGMVLMLLEEARRETNAAHAELAVAHEKLLHESLTDILTGVYNRMAFTRGIFLQAAGSTYGSVFIFDLDNLKHVNDSHGHEAGDELLKYFVLVLRGGLRPADQLYRWGGDEFLLLLPGATYVSVAERLNRLLYKAPPLTVFDGSVSLKLEVSMGGADYGDLDGLRNAVNTADRAMYEQKRTHKTAPPSPDAPVEDMST
ncbi:MAG: GGDEF domain-containing protein [Bacillota bacterium]